MLQGKSQFLICVGIPKLNKLRFQHPVVKLTEIRTSAKKAPEKLAYVAPHACLECVEVTHFLAVVDNDGRQEVELNVGKSDIRSTAHERTSFEVRRRSWAGRSQKPLQTGSHHRQRELPLRNEQQTSVKSASSPATFRIRLKTSVH